MTVFGNIDDPCN